MKIVGLSGSLRVHSIHRGILRAIHGLCEVESLEMTMAELADIPIYNQDVNAEGIPVSVMRVHEQLAAADAIVLASPEYNYSVSGVLKNAIDWLSRVDGQAFNGKAVLIVGASPGGLGTARSQYHLRQILVFMNAFIVNKPEVMISHSMQKFDEQGNLTDDKTLAHLNKAVKSLVALSGQLRK